MKIPFNAYLALHRLGQILWEDTPCYCKCVFLWDLGCSAFLWILLEGMRHHPRQGTTDGGKRLLKYYMHNAKGYSAMDMGAAQSLNMRTIKNTNISQVTLKSCTKQKQVSTFFVNKNFDFFFYTWLKLHGAYQKIVNSCMIAYKNNSVDLKTWCVLMKQMFTTSENI